MKVAHFSDLHLDEDLKFEETVDILKKGLQDAESRGAELAIITGDINNKTSTELSRLAFKECLTNSKMQFVIIKGNHDSPLDLMIYDGLGGRVQVTETPKFYSIKLSSGQIYIYAMPWFDKTMGGGKTIPEIQISAKKRYVEECKNMIGTVHNLSKSPTIFAGHITITESMVTEGQPYSNFEIQFSSRELMDTIPADYYLLGHIHKMQKFNDKMWYCGGINRFRFGEEEEKGYYLVDILKNKTEFIPISTPNLITIEMNVTNDSEGNIKIESSVPLDNYKGNLEDYVRVKCEIQNKHLMTLVKEKLQSVFPNEKKLKVDYTIKEIQKARSEEIVKVLTLWEKAMVYWQTANIDLQSFNLDSLKNKVGVLEDAQEE